MSNEDEKHIALYYKEGSKGRTHLLIVLESMCNNISETTGIEFKLTPEELNNIIDNVAENTAQNAAKHISQEEYIGNKAEYVGSCSAIGYILGLFNGKYVKTPDTNSDIQKEPQQELIDPWDTLFERQT